MNVEFSVTSESVKTRTIARLRAHGLAAASGPVRLAYPFSISVDGITDKQVADVSRMVHSIDPCAGRIVLGEATRSPRLEESVGTGCA